MPACRRMPATKIYARRLSISKVAGHTTKRATRLSADGAAVTMSRVTGEKPKKTGEREGSKKERPRGDRGQ